MFGRYGKDGSSPTVSGLGYSYYYAKSCAQVATAGNECYLYRPPKSYDAVGGSRAWTRILKLARLTILAAGDGCSQGSLQAAFKSGTTLAFRGSPWFSVAAWEYSIVYWQSYIKVLLPSAPPPLVLDAGALFATTTEILSALIQASSCTLTAGNTLVIPLHLLIC